MKLWKLRYIFMGYIWRGQQMNRLVEVEEDLRKMATGKLPLPDAAKCRELAIRVGTPKECWPKEMKGEK